MKIRETFKERSTNRNTGLLFSFSRTLFSTFAGILLLLVAFAGGVNAQAVTAGTAPIVVPTGGFAIDANLQANVVVNGIGDWISGAAGTGGYVMDTLGNPVNGGTTFHLTDNYSTNDNAFGGGLKSNDNPNSWTWVTGSSNGKTDINNVLVHFALDANGHQWVIIAADRMTNTGEAWMDFEFLQNTLTANPNGTFSSAGPNGGRTAGDFDLTFSTGGNFTLQTWQLVGSTYNYVTYAAPAGSVYGANNTGNIPVPFGAFGSKTYTTGLLTEGAVDITALLGSFNPCVELGIKTIFVKSKTSPSTSASIMDFVTPLQVAKLQFGVAVAGSNQTICSQGASTTFTMAANAASAPGDTLKSISWSVSSGSATITNLSSLATSVQVSSASATLVLTVTTKGGCTATDSVVLNVLSSPTASISGVSTVCSSTPVNLTASTNIANPVYLWSPGNATTSSITVPLSTSATYSVTVTASNGCSTTSAGHPITVNPALVTSVNPPTLLLCEGSSGNLCAISTGSALIYKWNSGLGDQCFITSVPNTYSVTVTDGNTGCTGTASVIVSLSQPPVVKVTPSGPVSFCQGDSVTLTASGATSYSWNTGATTEALKIKTQGLYTVTGSNSPGCSISVLIFVSVTPGPSVTITPSGSMTFCQGGSVMLHASGASTYLWSNGGTTLAIKAVTSGTYSVIGTDANGCKGNANKVVTVNPLPNVTLTNLPVVCVNGGPIDLNQGSPLGGIYSGSGISGTKFNPLTAGGVGNYTITYSYTNGNGCANSASASIPVINSTLSPGLITGPAAAVCANSAKTYSIAAVSNATSYTWTAPANASITAGQGTTSITVSFNGSFISGILSVKANGSCGSSSSNSLIISSTPAMPGVIFGNDNPCKRGINVYWVNPVPGADAYMWSVPPGTSIISGQGTDTITVNTGNKSGVITVKTFNACGTNGGNAVKSININCRTTDPSSELSSNHDIVMTAYPNPAHDLLHVLFLSNTEDNYSVRIYDMTGRIVYNELKKAEIGDNIIEINLNVKRGLYIVSLTSGDVNKQLKIVVE